MAKKMLIDATHAEETRVVVVDNNKVEEFDFESHSKRQLTGNIYLAKVTRVEPSLQAAFVEYGGNRHGFLAFSEIHPDYYQIPKEDREALLAEEAAFARASEEENGREKPKGRSRSRRKSAAAEEGAAAAEDAVVTGRVEAGEVPAGAEAGTEAAPDAPAPAPAEAAEGNGDNGSSENGDNGSSENGENGAPREGYEQVGGDDVEEERRSQRGRPTRRYKIQEVIKVRQILLVQVVKEERGNKGAALTTYLSLAGRYCVLMPNTARGGGISRKITQATDRKKLKDIASSLTVPEGAGLIIRTAGANRTKTEIKRDYEYLTRQWEQIRETTLKSIAPCLIYEEGSLIKRAIRDLYSRDIDEVLVDGERGYREAKDYMKMLMPSHAKNVKHYSEPLPLYSRFQVEGYLAAMFNPVVQLKSGGYIVIDVTEALVAIDVNSGRSTREGSVEDTALKTNLEAAEEAARQMRLRDLAGLIVIDFIDMDERKNNAAVEKRLKEKLKTDRARIQVGRISPFGLLEMSRQRLRPGMIEATTKACPHCHGTGRTRSDDSMALALLRELEEEGVRQRSKEVLIVAPVEIANYLLNQKREHVALIESRFGLSVRVEGDPSLISPDYRVERFKTASRILNVPEPVLPAIAPPEVEEEEEPAEEEDTEQTAEEAADRDRGEGGGDRQGGKRRRRRRRRGGRQGGETEAAPGEAEETRGAEPAEAGATGPAEAEPQPAEAGARSRSRRRSRGRAPAREAEEAASGAATGAEAEAEQAAPVMPTTPFDEVMDHREDAGPDMVEVPETDAPQPRRRRERVRKPATAVLAEVPLAVTAAGTPETQNPEPQDPHLQNPDLQAPEPEEAQGLEAQGLEAQAPEPQAEAQASDVEAPEPQAPASPEAEAPAEEAGFGGAEPVDPEAVEVPDGRAAETAEANQPEPAAAEAGWFAPASGSGLGTEPSAAEAAAEQAVPEPAEPAVPEQVLPEHTGSDHTGSEEAISGEDDRPEGAGAEAGATADASEPPAEPATAAEDEQRPRRRGWWSRALGGS